MELSGLWHPVIRLGVAWVRGHQARPHLLQKNIDANLVSTYGGKDW